MNDQTAYQQEGTNESETASADVTSAREAGRAPTPAVRQDGQPRWLGESGTESNGLTAGEYVHLLLRSWWLVLLLPLLTASLAFAVFQVLGRSYTATTTLLVQPLRDGADDLTPDVQSAILLARSYGRLAASPAVLEGAISALTLTDTPTTLLTRTRIRAEADTQLITIAVDDRDPARAAQIANTLGSTFVNWVSTNDPAAGPGRITLVAPADVPTRIKGLPTVVYVGLAGAFGLALALLGAYLLDRVSRRIWNARDVWRVVGEPVLVRLVRPRGLVPSPRLVAARMPLSPASEAIRTLWIKLGLTVPRDTVQTLLVTSAGPARGKSAIAANLAVSLAQAGRRVVLVDGNVRAPQLDRLFSLSNRPGLLNLLAGTAGGVSDHLADGPVAGLKLMLVGTATREERHRFAVRPLELVAALELLAAILRPSTDIIVVDGPALLDGPQALLFAAVAGQILVVVQEGETRPDDLGRALDDLRSIETGEVGLVLAGAGW